MGGEELQAVFVQVDNAACLLRVPCDCCQERLGYTMLSLREKMEIKMNYFILRWSCESLQSIRA